jgi:hypothetical protein
VATSGVAIVAADLKVFVVSWIMWVLAIAIYALMTSLILSRASAGTAFQLDGWILMGGLAIATWAAARLHTATAVATWVLATAWIPALLYVTVEVGRRLCSSVGGRWFSRWECTRRRHMPLRSTPGGTRSRWSQWRSSGSR